MRFHRIIGVLRRGWVTVAILVVLGTAVGAVLTLKTPKVYRSSAQIFVATAANPDPAHPAAPNSHVAAAVRSYARRATQPTVLHAVITQLGLHAHPSRLAKKISVDVPANTVLINIEVTAGGPVQTAQLANTVAEQLDRTVEGDTADPTNTSRIRLQLVRAATVPHTPAQPDAGLNLGVGALIGLLLGGGVLVLLAVSDNTVRTPRDLRALPVPLLAIVPSDARSELAPIAVLDDPDSPRSDAYRALAAHLETATRAPFVAAVTGATSSDPASVVAANLAAALALDGQRVCLLDLDVHAARLTTMLGLADRPGLASVLATSAPMASVAYNVGPDLAAVPIGTQPDADLITVAAVRSVLAEIKDAVDVVVLDVAPVLGNADAIRICGLASCCVLAHRSGHVTRSQVRRSGAALSRAGQRPVGAVLTDAPLPPRRLGRHRSGNRAPERDDVLAHAVGSPR